MNAPAVLAEPNLAQIDFEIRRLRQTIALEQKKAEGIAASMERHKKGLARLEAQRAMSGSAQTPHRMSGRS